jgi:hypothetical protein
MAPREDRGRGFFPCPVAPELVLVQPLGHRAGQTRRAASASALFLEKKSIFGGRASFAPEGGIMRSIRILSWSSLLWTFAAGCGSESAAPPGAGGTGVDAGAGVDTGSGNPGTRPCGIHSGYDGDDFCILPPDPSLGFQLHYGPQNYDDPEEVQKYVLMPGQETTDCVFMKTPNEVEVFHSEYHGRMRPGSHHMLVFTRSSEWPDSAAPEPCNQGLDTAMILGAQTPTIDIDRAKNTAPENDGLAQKLAPKAQAVFQLHYLNSSSKPMLREAWANVIYRDPATVKALSDPIFFLAG